MKVLPCTQQVGLALHKCKPPLPLSTSMSPSLDNNLWEAGNFTSTKESVEFFTHALGPLFNSSLSLISLVNVNMYTQVSVTLSASSQNYFLVLILKLMSAE